MAFPASSLNFVNMPAFPIHVFPQPALVQPQQIQKQEYQQFQVKTVWRPQHLHQQRQYPQPTPVYHQQQTMCSCARAAWSRADCSPRFGTRYERQPPLVQVTRLIRVLAPPAPVRRVFISETRIDAEATEPIALEATEAKEVDLERKRKEAIRLKQEEAQRKTREFERLKHEDGQIAARKKAQPEEAERIIAERIASKSSTASTSTAVSDSFTSSEEYVAAVGECSREGEEAEEELEGRIMYVECLQLATKLEEELRGETTNDSASRRADFRQILALYGQLRNAAPSISPDASEAH